MRAPMSNGGRVCPRHRSRSSAFHSKPLLDVSRRPSPYPDMICIIAFTRLQFAPEKWSRRWHGQPDRNKNKHPNFGEPPQATGLSLVFRRIIAAAFSNTPMNSWLFSFRTGLPRSEFQQRRPHRRGGLGFRPAHAVPSLPLRHDLAADSSPAPSACRSHLPRGSNRP